LDGLEGEGLKEDTVVLLHGDHGWQLGEHDSWHKFTKYAAYGTCILLCVYA
jgi:iduronate 2-sulfatase